MKRLLLLIPGLALLAFLGACGQNGPLYLPGNPSEIQPPPEEPAEQEDGRKKPAQSDAQ